MAWDLIAVAVIFAVTYAFSTWQALQFAARVKEHEEKFVVDVLDRFLSRKIEDIQTNQLLAASATGDLNPDEDVEEEGDPTLHGMTPEQVRATLEATEAELHQAEEAGLR